MLRSMLIANRGEIAVRIIRCCRDLGIRTVAVYSAADRGALHVVMADEAVCIGPANARDSYLNREVLVTTAKAKGVDAIHPGYGFLSENPEFAELVEAQGLTFVGPAPDHIRMMGDKVSAKQLMAEHGIPLVPGSAGAVSGPSEAEDVARRIGYPLLVKAARGGGGRGMTVVRSKAELASALARSMGESESAFGDSTIYLERYLETPRHIEIQVACDTLGNAVHFGDRDCSVQRRHQKIIEEAHSPAIDAQQRDALGELAVRMMRSIGYRGVGTLEFLYEDGVFAFIEMNTRIQVEHPVTELVYGVDLIREQIRVASGLPLSVRQVDLAPRGHAIECRVAAENPLTFAPSPGRASEVVWPAGPGVRVDSALQPGSQVPPHYDSMVGKIIVHAQTRQQAIERMRRAIRETKIAGIHTNLALHEKILASDAFAKGAVHVHWLENFMRQPALPDSEIVYAHHHAERQSNKEGRP